MIISLFCRSPTLRTRTVTGNKLRSGLAQSTIRELIEDVVLDLGVRGIREATQIIVREGISECLRYLNEALAVPTLPEFLAYDALCAHLPGIPSAAEVESKGLELGAMQAKMMEKIEELTLHLIRLEKENALLKQEVKGLKR